MRSSALGLIFIWTFGYFAPFAFAITPNGLDDCTYINLTESGKPMESMPTLDQMGTQICYAHIAAQTIDAYRFSHGDTNKKFLSSGEAIALDYAIYQKAKNLYEGGVACDAILQARNSGVCNSALLPNVEQLTKYSEEFKNIPNTSQKALEGWRRDYHLSDQEVAQLQKLLKLNNLLEVVRFLFTRNCNNSRMYVQVPNCSGVDDEAKPSEEFRKAANLALNLPNPQPVALGVSKNLFSYNKSPASYTIERRPQTNDEFIRYSPHSVLIVGRRRNNQGTCQYLVRDTMSKSYCPQGLVQERNWECTPKGDLWVGAKELMDASFQALYLDDAFPKGNILPSPIAQIFPPSKTPVPSPSAPKLSPWETFKSWLKKGQMWWSRNR